MTEPQPVDQARTHQPRAGAAMKDGRGLVGYLLIGLAVLFLVVCLAAAAMGNQGWTVGAAAATVLTAAVGSIWVFADRRRIARLAQRSPADSTRNRKGNAGA